MEEKKDVKIDDIENNGIGKSSIEILLGDVDGVLDFDLYKIIFYLKFKWLNAYFIDFL